MIFVVAALLWAAVLVPSWVRRREFKVAEQNAVRLQRTLRVLAETAEVPTEVRVEATAREALAHEKLLRTAQRQQEAERRARLAEARAAQVRAEMRAQQMKRKQAALARSAKLHRPVVRRLRAFAALIAVIALAGMLVGTGFVFAGQGWMVLVGAGLGFIAALGGLVLMAPGRVKMVEIPAEQIVESVPARTALRVDEGVVEAGEDRAVAAHAAAQAAAAARIERARAMARARAERPAALRNQPQSMLLEQAREQVLAARPGAAAAPAAAAEREAEEAVHAAEAAERSARAAAAQARAQAAADRSQQLATAERLRKMGVVGDPSEGMLDLDAALRQRRSAS